MKKVYTLFFLLLFISATLSAQINGTLTYGGQNRSYILHIPASYTGQQAVPLVFVLHGFTQTAAAMQAGSGFDAVSEASGWIVVYANGVNNAWNTNSGFPGGSTADDVGFLTTLADTLSNNYNIDYQRIYSCGFSAGGFMSHLLGCSRADRFAAVAGVSGTMSAAAETACQPSRPVPVMQIHGTSDNVVNYNGGFGGIGVEALVSRWRSLNGCTAAPQNSQVPDTVSSDNSTVIRELSSGCDGCAEVELLKVESGGHTWPGTSSTLFGLGTINRDIKAEIEIWNFFQRFSLAGCNSIAVIPADEVKFFPNPALDNLQITLKHDVIDEVVVYNLTGQQVLSLSPQSAQAVVNVSCLPAATYICKLRSGNALRMLSFVKK